MKSGCGSLKTIGAKSPATARDVSTLHIRRGGMFAPRWQWSSWQLLVWQLEELAECKGVAEHQRPKVVVKNDRGQHQCGHTSGRCQKGSRRRRRGQSFGLTKRNPGSVGDLSTGHSWQGHLVCTSRARTLALAHTFSNPTDGQDPNFHSGPGGLLVANSVHIFAPPRPFGWGSSLWYLVMRYM